MKTLLSILLFVLWAPLHAADAAPPFPLWDGHESVEAYATRAGLAPTKTIDLGNGVTLDLVLIPAGKFRMGAPEPQPPAVTFESAYILIATGAIAALWLLEMLLPISLRRGKFVFSLKWLFLMMLSLGLIAGGIARAHLAKTQETRFQTERDVFASGDEIPAHAEIIERPFYMGKYTVTNAQYGAVMYRRGKANDPQKQKPVAFTKWGNALEFCVKLSEQSKNPIQLPTEAQWEFACRAGTTTAFNTGDTLDPDAACFTEDEPPSGLMSLGPALVGSYKPNAFGLYDMHGNVGQWCIGKGSERVIRGGSWQSDAAACSSSARVTCKEYSFKQPIGFRVIQPIQSQGR